MVDGLIDTTHKKLVEIPFDFLCKSVKSVD